MKYYHCMLESIDDSDIPSKNKAYLCKEHWAPTENDCFDTEEVFLKNFKNKKFIYHSLPSVKFCTKCVDVLSNYIEYL